MDYILLPLADFIESTFTILPILGNNMNTLLCVVGGVATTVWIGLMLKYEKQEVPNRR